MTAMEADLVEHLRAPTGLVEDLHNRH